MKRAGLGLAWAMTALLVAGCTTADVLEPPAAVGEDDAGLGAKSLAAEFSPPTEPAPLSPAPAAPPPTATQNVLVAPDPIMPQGDGGPVALASSNERIMFGAVVGANAQEIAPLTQRILQRAAERGIVVAGRDDPSATLVVKGYFSTLQEAGGVTLVYVWDVFDRAGTRVHRIQGKTNSLGAAGNEIAMRKIADSTIDQLSGWLAARQS